MISQFRLFLLLLLLAIAPTASAWGVLGHALIAELAERQLTPAAKAEVAHLLASENQPNLAAIASWADALRYSDPERFKQTSRWHYINAKGGGCGFDLPRDCPNGDCVVQAIEDQLRLLKDRQQPIDVRRDALKFVVHLVGDEHQPMHAGNRTDSGGNRFQISLRTPIQPEDYARNQYVNGVMGTNLHSIWDYYILASRGLDLSQYAAALDRKPNRKTRQQLQLAQTPLAWAGESCQLIDAKNIYPANDQHVMTHAYLDTMRPLAEQRVQLASIRLAQLLNAALGG